MATLEERIQTLEQENAARKKAEELLTITVRALVSKEAFEKLQDTVEKLQDTVENSQKQYSKLFDVLNTHNAFTNERLGDIQGQLIELDGKIVGLQTETRQRLTEQDSKTNTRFNQIDNALAQILARLPEKP